MNSSCSSWLHSPWACSTVGEQLVGRQAGSQRAQPQLRQLRTTTVSISKVASLLPCHSQRHRIPKHCHGQAMQHSRLGWAMMATQFEWSAPARACHLASPFNATGVSPSVAARRPATLLPVAVSLLVRSTPGLRAARRVCTNKCLGTSSAWSRPRPWPRSSRYGASEQALRTCLVCDCRALHWHVPSSWCKACLCVVDSHRPANMRSLCYGGCPNTPAGICKPPPTPLLVASLAGPFAATILLPRLCCSAGNAIQLAHGGAHPAADRLSAQADKRHVNTLRQYERCTEQLFAGCQ